MTDSWVAPPLVGATVRVPCSGGINRRYIHLDNAASTPALAVVRDAVEQFLPYYSSAHRGTGYKSRVTTAALEGARAAVAEFVDARDDDVVVFVRNTTEAINLLSTTFEPDERVLHSPFEHHANMLPWRRQRAEPLPFSCSRAELIERTRQALREANGEIRLLAISGASNVTGEVLPVEQLTALAHEHGALVLLDAAQQAPHRPVSIRATGVDYLALSGHKLYAPYGTGVLVGRRARLAAVPPLLRGGGAIRQVTLDSVEWADLPDRCEAGSPNVIGAVALGVASDTLRRLGMERIAEHELVLARRLRERLGSIEGLRPLRMFDLDPQDDAVGVTSFVIDGHDHRVVAATLGFEHGIGVRDGRFCAHPLLQWLLGGSPGGAVRASLGLGNRPDDIDALTAALAQIAADDASPAAAHDGRVPPPQLLARLDPSFFTASC